MNDRHEFSRSYRNIPQCFSFPRIRLCQVVGDLVEYDCASLLQDTMKAVFDVYPENEDQGVFWASKSSIQKKEKAEKATKAGTRTIAMTSVVPTGTWRSHQLPIQLSERHKVRAQIASALCENRSTSSGINLERRKWRWSICGQQIVFRCGQKSMERKERIIDAVSVELHQGKEAQLEDCREPGS